MQPNNESGAVETVQKDSCGNVYSISPLVVRLQVIMVIYKITRGCLQLTLLKMKAFFFSPFNIKEIFKSY